MKTSVGNILSITDGVIIHQVNCQGVMGSGVAKAIRDKWPIVWDEYTALTGPQFTQKENGTLLLGTVSLTQVEAQVFVANVFGQQFFHTRGSPEGVRYTSYDALDRAFIDLADLLSGFDLPLHFPLLGSDRGGAHWPTVRSIIEHRLHGFDLTLWLLPGKVEPS